MSAKLCPGVLHPDDKSKTYRRATAAENQRLKGWGFEEQPPELSGFRVKRPRLRCYTCGGRFLASYHVDSDGGEVYFTLPPHKPNKVGRRKTKKVFDQKRTR